VAPLGDAATQCCSAGDSSTLTTIVAVVGWVLVIAGWLVVNRNAARHAHRAQDLEQVRTVEGRLSELCVRAVEYYTGTLNGIPIRAQEAHIKRELKALFSAIGRLRERFPKHYRELGSRMIELRTAMTGGEFESKVRKVVDHDHEVVQRILLASDHLIDDLWREFEKAHTL
jgi:hypothetical protein